MGIFGWSYPPGCSGVPDDEDCGCGVCMKSVDDCICPECPVCGTHGDPKCYEEHGLVLSEEQKKSATEYEEMMVKENEYWERYAEEERKYWDDCERMERECPEE